METHRSAIWHSRYKLRLRSAPKVERKCLMLGDLRNLPQRARHVLLRFAPPRDEHLIALLERPPFQRHSSCEFPDESHRTLHALVVLTAPSARCFAQATSNLPVIRPK